MNYRAPTFEQLFALRHTTEIDDLANYERFAAAGPELVEAIVKCASAFAEGEYGPLSRSGDQIGARWDDGQVIMPPGFGNAYHGSVKGGWGSISGPVAYGGQGLPFALTTVVLECLGSANFGLNLIHGLTIGAIEAIENHGTPEQKAKWLPKLITGEWPGTMNLTEPHAGSDVGALRASAEPISGALYRIKGTKIFITFGEHDMAENIVHLVLARTPGAPQGTRGISLFLVPKYRLDAQGQPAEFNHVRCLSIEKKLGIHASPTCVMSFGEDGECIGELIGDEGSGMRAMFTMMNSARLNVGNQGVQIAEVATQRALGYASQRVQSARSDGSSGKQPVAIIEHPDVRRMLMRMRALTQAARALVYYAAGRADRSSLGISGAAERLDLLTPMVKAYCTDIGCEVASIAIQIHGGMGFIEETGVAQLYRDVRITPIYEGTNGIQAADLVGRKLVSDGGAALLELLDEIGADSRDEIELEKLRTAVSESARWMLGAGVNDRLAGSYPFLTMTAGVVAGWLLLRQERAAKLHSSEYGERFSSAKCAAARYYLTQIVPEIAGLEAQVRVGADVLYALSTDTLTA
ncbi:acyl-CoA dehydrogenase [Cupriavidus numazuensis]|uniref:3-methylmercaptopropionyl-CoA dehydrogenase n=1 Tax=Cupriavidus numazuensis TaxID=221992 RepID=A0ABM8TWI5_9BURK|nr:acyl-CoA dehydrogenase [Cupriavidus numazuensis]CAG2161171.1 3-methylmercaptopropionyl-CoA dehydrogenase [Cupriavidus numazuensis]